MFVTPFGIVIDASPEQAEKASYPMAVTPSGITVPLHPRINVSSAVRIIALQFLRES